MFQQMMQMMEAQAAAALERKASARGRWFQEWAQYMGRAFDPDVPVVYTSLYAFPGELLAAFDVAPFDFEIAGAMISGTPMGVPSMQQAENRGYGMDICSFHRGALGAYFQEWLPKPDLMITTSYHCDQKAKTNDLIAHMAGVEALLLEAPSAVTAESVRYVERQLRGIAARVGAVAGQELDEDRLKEAVRHSNRARRAQLRMLELLKHRPAPWGGNTLIGYSINGRQFTGTPVHEQLHQGFIREMEERIRTGHLNPERHRILWFAWLPIYDVCIFDVLREHQASIPMCETMRVHWDEIDEDRPFEGLALKCLTNPFVGPHARRTEGLAELVEAYGIDGAILFATPACRAGNTTNRLLHDELAALDIPFLTLDVDISDPRGYSAEQTKTRLEGFIEVLDQRAEPVPATVG